MSKLTHINEQGRAKMVDVSAKDDTRRLAVAQAYVRLKPETLELIASGGITKGDVLAVAQVAGVLAAKETSRLIPMCHPLFITAVDISFTLDTVEQLVKIRASVATTGKTGVEMEALTAVSVAALTIYDMCKAVDKEMEITHICLLEKQGGKSGDYRRVEGGEEGRQ
ncbi:MAG: cyclic pyranopterin monophosphate synthase MoaC [Dethiobacter sp.]|nr:cyclic pyranopterin monophosphate synthase MoaC [Dethiobacter sp.]MBS3901161.1 cyclic pyranopterin monophosphate synthase MoaC [Dethiobacter sp.]MBS3989147.1 cyclic pyranopterin monophosphate synthase MoaC [Dethiobacter sp.]